MITLSNYALEGIGFSEYPDSDELEIRFSIVRVFSVEGLNFSPESSTTRTEVFEFGSNCSAVVANSLNEACQVLTGDNFVDDDENQWAEQRKARPPFALIRFQEFETRTLKGGWRKEDEGSLITYDAFPEGKADIREWEKQSLPSIVTSLVVNLSTLDRPVNLVPVERAVSGQTNEGIAVFDFKLESSGRISVSSGKTDDELNESLSKSKETFKHLEYKTSRHFYSALNEKDRLKQFLGYFFFIERYTHRKFKQLNFAEDARLTFSIPERLLRSGNLFFEDRFSDSKSLGQRFVWCAILTWHHLDDTDVDIFFELKKTRDKLTHGEEIPEVDLPVETARALASRLLGAH